MAFLYNTTIVVTIAFIIFVGILIYLKVPAKISALLDARANGIRDELDRARQLREEAQEIAAEYERKLAEVEQHSQEIVSSAKRNAEAAAEEARAKLDAQVTRRIESGKEQIASAEASVERQIRDRSVKIATETARSVITQALAAKDVSKSIDDAIADVGGKLN